MTGTPDSHLQMFQLFAEVQCIFIARRYLEEIGLALKVLISELRVYIYIRLHKSKEL